MLEGLQVKEEETLRRLAEVWDMEENGVGRGGKG